MYHVCVRVTVSASADKPHFGASGRWAVVCQCDLSRPSFDCVAGARAGHGPGPARGEDCRLSGSPLTAYECFGLPRRPRGVLRRPSSFPSAVSFACVVPITAHTCVLLTLRPRRLKGFLRFVSRPDALVALRSVVARWARNKNATLRSPRTSTSALRWTANPLFHDIPSPLCCNTHIHRT